MSGGPGAPRLSARAAHLAYDRRTVSAGVDVDVRDGSFTVIVGPNACGKSTLLRALSRLLKPEAGTVLLDGTSTATSTSPAAAGFSETSSPLRRGSAGRARAVPDAALTSGSCPSARARASRVVTSVPAAPWVAPPDPAKSDDSAPGRRPPSAA